MNDFRHQNARQLHQGDIHFDPWQLSDVNTPGSLFFEMRPSSSRKALRRFVREGHVAVDIGANVGAVSLALAKAVGEMGRVEAFEPGPMFFSRLEANLELNPGLKKRVRTHRIGLSATRGALVWQPSVSISGTALMSGSARY